MVVGVVCLAVLGSVRAEDEPTEPPPPEVEPVAGPTWKRLKPEQVISDKTILYLATSNYQKAKAAYDKSHLSGLVNEESVAELLSESWGLLKENYINGDGTRADFEKRRRAFELDLIEKAFQQFQGTAAVAIESPTEDAAAAGGNTKLINHRFLVVFDLPVNIDGPRKKAQIEQLMDLYRTKLTRDRLRYEHKPKSVGPYVVQDIYCQPLNLHEGWAFVENLFIYGQGEGIVENAVRAFHESRRDTLARAENFLTSQRQIGASQHAEAYVNMPAALIAKLHPRLQDGIKRIQEHLRVEGDLKLAVGLQFGEGKDAGLVREKIVLPSTLGNNAPPAPVRSLTAYLVPRDALAYWSRSYDLVELLKQAHANHDDPLNKSFGDANQKQTIVDRLMELLNVDSPEKVYDELKAFKGECAVWLGYRRGVSYDGSNFQSVHPMVIALEFNRDLARLGAVLSKIRENSQIPYRDVLFNNGTVWYQEGAEVGEVKPDGVLYPFLGGLGQAGKVVNVSIDGPARKPWFVAYAEDVDVIPRKAGEQSRKFLVLSDNLKALQKALRQTQALEQSLAEQPGFKSMMEAFGEDRDGFLYLDEKLLSMAYYRTFEPWFVRTMQLQDDDKKKIPREKVLISHAGNVGFSRTQTNSGNQYDLVSTTGIIPTFALYRVVKLPQEFEQQRVATSLRIIRNLREISLALHLFAAENDRFPSHLSELSEFIPLDRISEVFSSPFNPGAVKTWSDVDVVEKTNLEYVPDHDLTDLSDGILVYEHRPTSVHGSVERGFKSFHHVLLMNNQIRVYLSARLKRKLAGLVDFTTMDLEADVDQQLEKLEAPPPTTTKIQGIGTSGSSGSTPSTPKSAMPKLPGRAGIGQ